MQKRTTKEVLDKVKELAESIIALWKRPQPAYAPVPVRRPAKPER